MKVIFKEERGKVNSQHVSPAGARLSCQLLVVWSFARPVPPAYTRYELEIEKAFSCLCFTGAWRLSFITSWYSTVTNDSRVRIGGVPFLFVCVPALRSFVLCYWKLEIRFIFFICVASA